MGDSFHLSTADLAALAFFLLAWVLHTLASDGKLVSRVSLTTAMNVQREAWMRTMAEREIRIVDTAIMSGLQQGTAFFASSSLIALGGCFALLGASDQVLDVLNDLPLERDLVALGLPDQGLRPGADPGLRLLQVRLGIPSLQLLHDPDRRGADPAWRGLAQSGQRNGGVARGAHEHAGRQAFQFRPARRVLLDRLSRLVRRPDRVRAVDAAASGGAGAAPVLLGGADKRSIGQPPGPGKGWSIRPDSQ